MDTRSTIKHVELNLSKCIRIIDYDQDEEYEDEDEDEIYAFDEFTKPGFFKRVIDLNNETKLNLNVGFGTFKIRLIHIAVILNEMDFLKWLIENGANVNAEIIDVDLIDYEDITYLTALHLAAIGGNVDALKMLLAESKEPVNAIGFIKEDSIELIKGRRDPDSFYSEHFLGTPLHFAIYGCHTKEKIEDIINALLEAGADPLIGFEGDDKFMGNAYYMALLCGNRAAWDTLIAWRPWKPNDRLLAGYVPANETDEEFAKQIHYHLDFYTEKDDPEYIKFEEKLYMNIDLSDEDPDEDECWLPSYMEFPEHQLIADMWMRKRYFAYTAEAS